jgi:regulator of PEP synthase PpsR (kinase-PPPase family)
MSASQSPTCDASLLLHTAPIYIVSGGVGASGEEVVRTALAQFEAVETPIRIFPHVRTEDQLRQILNRAAVEQAIVVHTLVVEQLRGSLVQLAADAGVREVDLLGPLLGTLSETLGRSPLGQPGRYRQLHAASFARVAAIEFTLAHDDGSGQSEWPEAEVVLAGISRVGKTPTSIYLGTLGWRVANVPIIHTMPPPAGLMALDRRRVIGLTIDPSRLATFRSGRQRRLGMPLGQAYVDPGQLYDEVDHALQLFRRGGFQVVDVTDKPVEQIADEVLQRVPASI